MTLARPLADQAVLENQRKDLRAHFRVLGVKAKKANDSGQLLEHDSLIAEADAVLDLYASITD